MKILNNDKCIVDYGMLQLKAFESIDVTTEELERFKAPIAILLQSGYASNKRVGFYPNLNSLLSSLI